MIGAVMAGASRIIAVDVNPGKFEIARQLGATDCVNPLDYDMVFAIYLPPQAEIAPVPVLYWLSGLTCTDENFMHKAGRNA